MCQEGCDSYILRIALLSAVTPRAESFFFFCLTLLIKRHRPSGGEAARARTPWQHSPMKGSTSVMPQDNSEVNVAQIQISDHLAIVAPKCVLQYRLQRASGCVHEQEAVLKPAVSYHTLLTPSATDFFFFLFFFLRCPLQKLRHAFPAATRVRSRRAVELGRSLAE